MEQHAAKKITPFIWFNNNAEEAIKFYSSIFQNCKINKQSFYGEGGMAPKGTLMTAAFELEGQSFIAFNGGPQFQLTEAISFVINCHTQEEVDHYWDRLSEGGQKSRCGWLKDKFGLSWQVVPEQLVELLSSTDSSLSNRVMQAMLKMDKLEIDTLQKAADNKQ
jgi:predicted 3-demethylubiquinone-9 3-methyltransferase (glyoxalase superfamily)